MRIGCASSCLLGRLDMGLGWGFEREGGPVEEGGGRGG